MQGDINKGIYLKGGTIKAKNIAVGDQAQIVIKEAASDLRQRGLDELADQLLEFKNVLEANANQLDNADLVRDATNSIAEELQKDRPNKLTVMSFINRISNSVQSVAGLANALGALERAVSRLF